MLIEQTFGLRGPGPPGRIMYSYNWSFSRQNNNLLGKYSTRLLFTAEILQEECTLLLPTLGKSLQI